MKKKLFKALKGVALAAVMTAALTHQGAADLVKAATKAEVEAAGTEIKLNSLIADSLENCKSENWYCFDITQPGYFTVSLGTTADTDSELIDQGWNLSVYDSDGMKEIKTYSRIEKAMETGVFAMHTGRYYVRVAAYNSYGEAGAPEGAIYSLKVNYTVSNNWEIENSNDQAQGATEIKLGSTYYGSTYCKTDEDYYKFTTTKDGFYQLQFRVDENTNFEEINYGWKVAVLDKNFKVIKEYTNVESDFDSVRLPFKAGTYYVRINSHIISDTLAPVDYRYNVKVNFTASSVWEKEGNDTNTSATAILPDTTYHGTTHSHEDVDYFKVKTTKTGYYQLKFVSGKTNLVDNIHSGWNVSILNSNYNVIKKYTYVTTGFDSVKLPFKKGTYYVVIEPHSDYSDDTAPVDCSYSINFKQTASPYWERELNDTLKTATSIKLNKAYNGVTYSNEDEDWFKLSAPASGRAKLTFVSSSKNNSEDIDYGWKLFVYNKKNMASPIAKVPMITSKASVNLNLKKGNYYVKIAPVSTYGDGSAPTNCCYQIKATYAKNPSRATIITKITPGKRKATLKWKKVSGATGYYIYRSTSKTGKFKRIAKIKRAGTVTYTDKKLKSGKKYYYKVVAFNKVSNVTATGKASVVRFTKIK